MNTLQLLDFKVTVFPTWGFLLYDGFCIDSTTRSSDFFAFKWRSQFFVKCHTTWDTLQDSAYVSRGSINMVKLKAAASVAADWQLREWKGSVDAAVGGIKREAGTGWESDARNVWSFQF